MRSEIVKAKPEHIHYLAANLREADKQELYDLNMMGAEEGLTKSLEVSMLAWTGFINHNPVCMFGVSDISQGIKKIGAPWMMGTEEIAKHATTFLRESKDVVDEMKSFFDLLINYVSAENTMAIEWLKWLGFTCDDNPVTLGPFNKKYYRFWMENV